ncbi:MAG: Hsp20/alpha crystallin family protein [Deltaproteobacteria bacterium]|nr:MAG: Hsp20/alpha crystallin family protein [Deltaproteobacteria bacterium]
MSLIRRVTPEHPVPSVKPEADPFRWFLRWDPFREMTPSWFGAPPVDTTFMPPFEVKETKDTFLFRADLPGMNEQDIEVKLAGDRLTISGKREAEREEKDDTYYAFERCFGSFLRTFTLPDGFDNEHVFAELKDGVLTVVVYKKPIAQAKTIAIKGGDFKKS